MACTPGIFSAAAVSSLTTRPLAIVASTGTAYNIPGKWKSDAYIAAPLTFSGPSMRGCGLPMTDICVLSGIIKAKHSLGVLRREFQRVYQAAFGQFYLEAVLTLRLGATQRCIRRLLENCLCRRLTC